MKTTLKQQLSLLFPTPYTREQRHLFPEEIGKHDHVQPCTGCGEPVVTRRYTKDGIESEYIDRQGRGWCCAFRANR